MLPHPSESFIVFIFVVPSKRLDNIRGSYFLVNFHVDIRMGRQMPIIDDMEPPLGIM